VCPRDGQPGCSIVDAVDPCYQGLVTHFVSWCWSYKLNDFVSAIAVWAQKEEQNIDCIFLWICSLTAFCDLLTTGLPTSKCSEKNGVIWYSVLVERHLLQKVWWYQNPLSDVYRNCRRKWLPSYEYACDFVVCQAMRWTDRKLWQ